MDIYKAKLVFFHGTKNFTKKKKRHNHFNKVFWFILHRKFAEIKIDTISTSFFKMNDNDISECHNNLALIISMLNGKCDLLIMAKAEYL